MLNFPNAPTPGATYNAGGVTWMWDGVKWTTTASASADVVNSAAVGNSGRNLVHNPRFEIWQRGTGPWTGFGNYLVDRWQLNGSTDANSVSLGNLSDADRASIGDESARYSLLNIFTGNAAAGSSSFVIQRIEGVRRLAGKTITISFYANAASALKLGVNVVQSFGSGGSPSGAVVPNGQSVSIPGATFARYSVTFAVPSVAGKTLGTNNDDCTQLEFWYSSGSTSATRAGNIGVQSGTVNLWGVQLEVGSVATPLAKRDIADELALCQRFYSTGTIRYIGYQAGGAGINCLQTLPAPMRALPTVTPTFTTQTNIVGSTTVWDAQTVGIGGTVTALGSFVLTGSYTASADL